MALSTNETSLTISDVFKNIVKGDDGNIIRATSKNIVNLQEAMKIALKETGATLATRAQDAIDTIELTYGHRPSPLS